MQACADRMCKAGGYLGGFYNSASNNMCDSSATNSFSFYYLVDRGRWFWGRAYKEAKINATCEFEGDMEHTPSPPPSTTAPPPDPGDPSTTEDGVDDNVVTSTTMTKTSSVATTRTSTIITATTTSTAKPTTSTSTAAATSMAATTSRTASMASTTSTASKPDGPYDSTSSSTMTSTTRTTSTEQVVFYSTTASATTTSGATQMSTTVSVGSTSPPSTTTSSTTVAAGSTSAVPTSSVTATTTTKSSSEASASVTTSTAVIASVTSITKTVTVRTSTASMATLPGTSTASSVGTTGAAAGTTTRTATTTTVIFADGLSGAVVMSTTDPATFCSGGVGAESVAGAVRSILGLSANSVTTTTECRAVQGRRLSQLASPGNVEVAYTMVPMGNFMFTSAHAAALEGAELAAMTKLVNTGMADQASALDVQVLGHVAFEKGAVTTTSTGTTSTTTTSATTTSRTTTTVTTTVPDFCAGEPVVLNGGDMSHCADIRNGATCKPVCAPGYTMNKTIICENGKFNVPGNCLPAKAKSKTMRAIQITLSLGSIFPGAGEDGTAHMNLEWAETNRGIILAAVAKTLGLPPGQVLVEFVLRKKNSGGATARRLQDAEEVLEMRVTVLVEETDDSNTVADLGEISQKYQDLLVRGDPGASADAAATDGSGGESAVAGGSPPGSFMSMLATDLQAQGRPMPSGMSVSAMGPPAVIDEFVVAISEWLFGDWQHCSAVCGGGNRTRKVECSSGDDFACVNDIGERPQSDASCEDYAGCAFDIRCPLGHDSDVECGAQAGASLGVVGVVSLCCLAALCRKLQVASRPHKAGTVILPDTSFGKKSGLKASYHIYRPDELCQKSTTAPSLWVSSTTKSMNLKSTGGDLEAGTEEGDGKTHVVWDTDAQALKMMFADRGTQLSFTARASEKSQASQGRPGLPRLASNSRLSDLGSPGSFVWGGDDRGDEEDAPVAAASAQDFDAADSDEELEARLEEISAFVDNFGDRLAEFGDRANPWAADAETQRAAGRFLAPNGRELHPLYQEGERVEYYSATLNRWLAASIRVALKPSTAVMRYDAVVTATKQRRVDVPLEDLRRPMRRNEAVEVFSRRRGAWLPACISPNQVLNATNYGFEVEFLGSEGQTDKVPASRLRRRYAPGLLVKVYRGAFVGWASGRIEAVAPDEDPEEGEEEEEEEEGESQADAESSRRRLDTKATFASQSSSVRELPTYSRKASVCTDASRAGACRPWFLVCVNFEPEDSDKVDRDWFPTYLIR